jgi:segregation and condensation protein A
LLEYKLVKEIATHLRQREEVGLQTHIRSSLLSSIEAQLAWTPPTLSGLEAQALAHAFQRLLDLKAREVVSGSEFVPTIGVRVSERIAEIVSLLQQRPSILLSDVVANEHSRFVVVVTFLAVLELWKCECINVQQDDLLGPIVLERGEGW